jgi:hypothetical protein
MSDYLFETSDFTYEIQELNEDGMPKKFYMKGIFQKADTPNGNKRVYPRVVLENALRTTKDLISEDRMLGELDHPADAKIHLEHVSHKVTKLEMMPNGHMYGEAEVLQTPAGRILESLIKSGIKLGISSRGFGTVKEVNGLNEVQNDYKLVTFDIVSDPSTPGAFPNPVYENKEEIVTTKENSLEKVISLDRFIENALSEDIQVTEPEKRYYVGRDTVNESLFYLVEGEKDSFGYLNFHMSHDYHVLVKKPEGQERVALSEENLTHIKRIYGKKVYDRLATKIAELGFNPETLNYKKEEL